MEILTYVQARGELPSELTEVQAELALTVSGRAREWIGRIAKMVQSDGGVSELDLVEASGMGRKILQMVPHEEWVYLVNPSLAPEGAMVVQAKIIHQGRLFSASLSAWLAAQEMGLIYRLSEADFTYDETKVVRKLWEKQETIVDRE
ncbi:MAG: hypothetical protein U0946_01480, partial [Patescibacteria group bacterium]|nr:hypothetical protein [Patescibacteria group bacterium]